MNATRALSAWILLPIALAACAAGRRTAPQSPEVEVLRPALEAVIRRVREGDPASRTGTIVLDPRWLSLGGGEPDTDRGLSAADAERLRAALGAVRLAGTETVLACGPPDGCAGEPEISAGGTARVWVRAVYRLEAVHPRADAPRRRSVDSTWRVELERAGVAWRVVAVRGVSVS